MRHIAKATTEAYSCVGPCPRLSTMQFADRGAGAAVRRSAPTTTIYGGGGGARVWLTTNDNQLSIIIMMMNTLRKISVRF